MPGSAVVDIRSSFGSAFIGLLISTALLGLMILQAWMYYWHCWNKDRAALKILIGFLVVMEVLHTILCAYVMYWYLILNFGNVENLRYNLWAMNLQVNISAIPCTAVQLFYARRIYIVSGSIFLPMVIVALLVFGNFTGFFFTAKDFIMKDISKVFHTYYWLSCAAMGSALLVDILVAGMMCWALYRKKTGFARTDSMIMTLMAYTINSGLLTCLLGTAMTVAFVFAPASMMQVAFFWIMGKCYVNSLLAMLNTRDYVRERSSAENTDNAFNLSSIRIEQPSEAYMSKSRRTGVSVTVHRSTASNFGQGKSDYDVGPTFEVPKPLTDTSITTSQNQSRTSGSSV
ncbi:hypothetical protein BJY52DRAFT_1393298 [Lactarius psammicola]|nr:hypothetical protein BJY52DRAFT_1393298 [Lactarius psammicola]